MLWTSRLRCLGIGQTLRTCPGVLPFGSGGHHHRSLTSSQASSRHLIAALVVNQPGCLAEIANLFSARGYNIDSLVVGRTESPLLSRMTVVVTGTPANVVNMKKQMQDLVQVALVDILSPSALERDLMLAKVRVSTSGIQSQVLELCQMFHASVVDARPDQMLIQLASTPARVDTFLEMLQPLVRARGDDVEKEHDGMLEIHRSGVIAMAREGKVTNVSSPSSDYLMTSSFEGMTQSILEESMDENLPPG